MLNVNIETSIHGIADFFPEELIQATLKQLNKDVPGTFRGHIKERVLNLGYSGEEPSAKLKDKLTKKAKKMGWEHARVTALILSIATKENDR